MRMSPIGSYTVYIIDDQGRVFSSRMSYDRPAGGMYAVDHHVAQMVREGVVMLEKRRENDPEGKHIQPHERIMRDVMLAVEHAVVESLSTEDDDEKEDALA